MRRKLTSVLLLFVLVFTSVDITAFATEQGTEESAIAETQQTEETGEENEGMTSSASQMQSESSTEKSTEEHSEKTTESEVETETVKTSENVPETETQTQEKTDTETETTEKEVRETSESDIEEAETDTKTTTHDESETEELETTETENMEVGATETETEETETNGKEKSKTAAKASGKDITRIEWVSALTSVFEMTVEEDNYPDNYFSDISADSPYYYDVMLASEFGLIDVEAGEDFNPDGGATREFVVHTLNLCLQYTPISDGYTFEESSTVTYPDDIQVAVELEWFELDADNKFYPEQVLKESEKDALIELAREEAASQTIDSNYNNSFMFKEGVIVLPEGVDISLTDDNEITLSDCDVELKKGHIFGFVVSGYPFVKKVENISIEGNKKIIQVSGVSQEEAYENIDVQGNSEISLAKIEAADTDNIKISYIVGGTREKKWEDGEKYDNLVGISENDISAVEITKTYELTSKQRAKYEIADGVNAEISCTIENVDVDWKNTSTECMVLLNADIVFHFNLSIDVFEALGVTPSMEVASIPVLFFGYAAITVGMDLSGSITLDITEYVSLGIRYVKHNKFGDRFRFVKEFRKKNFTIQTKAKLTLKQKLIFGFDIVGMNGNLNGEWGAAVTVDTNTVKDGEKPETCTHVESWMFASTGGYVKVIHLIGEDELWSYNHTIYNKYNSPVRVSFHYEDGKAVDRCTRDKTGTRYKYYTPANSRYGYNGASSGTGSNGEPYTIFEYSLNDEKEATITKYNGNVSALSIPSELDGYTVVGIGDRVFEDKTALRMVVIPDSVTKIGNGVFRNCKNISSIILSKNVESIGFEAFGNCDSLTAIEIPKSLKSTGSGSVYVGPFCDCDGLKSVTFEKGTTEIACNLFSSCSGIEEIVIPDTVTIIEYDAFEDCKNLRKVIMSNSLTEIESSAFEDCISLTEITIPDSVTKIGNGAFRNCKNISSIILSKNVESIGFEAFGNCDSLTAIEIPKSLKSTGSGSVYAGPFYDCDGLKSVTFEKGTTEIACNLFSSCSGIEEIVIPDTVTIIEYDAFEDCKNLRKVTMSNSLTEIESSAFEDCISLTEITIPDSVTKIGNGAFRNCKNISSIILSKNVESIGREAFGNCDSLTAIEIPKSLKSTGSGSVYAGPFYDCDGLKSVTFEKGTTEIACNLFSSCSGIEEIVIPDTVTIIEYDAFEDCKNLRKVTMPNSITEIESSAFEDCISLTEITIPDSVMDMGTYIFSGCSNLKEAKLPRTTKNIALGTFKNCSSLEKINFPESLEYIRAYAFYNTKLFEAVLPDKLTGIESYAFYNCDNLTKVELKNGISDIEEYAFYDCDVLTEIAIPDSVASIGSNIFAECELLNKVQLGTGLTKIPTYAFNLCPSLQKIVIPYRVKTIESNTFTKCTKLTEITIPRGTSSISTSAFSYPDKLTIYGISGTYAETYANQIGATFINKEVSATEVSLNTTELSIINGAKYTLILSVTPSDFTDEVVWQSSNADIVTVDNTGVITAKTIGTANVRVAVGNQTAVCAVTVVQPVTGISLNRSSLSLEAFEEYTLTATAYPSNAADKSIEWSTSDESVAVVSQTGVVTPVSKGTTVITAMAKDGSGEYAKCSVTVISDGVYCAKYSELESDHNYANNTNKIWMYKYSEAKTLDVTFDARTAIDEYGDFIYIYDSENKEIKKATGTELAGTTIRITGDTVKIKLVSDAAVTAWGFKISKFFIDGKEMNPEDETPEEKPEGIYTVIYDMQGRGEQIPPTTIKGGERLTRPKNPIAEGYTFEGWYKERICANKWNFDNDKVTENITLYAHWIKEVQPEEPSTEPQTESEITPPTESETEPETDPETVPSTDPSDTENQGNGLWISGISKTGYPYTGEPMRPAVKVYDKTTLLTEKTDYTISYKNNTKAGKATITVTGRGNYSGKETVTFDILPADIGSEEVYAMDFYVKIGKKAQKPTPELYYMGTKLKNNKDFTISYANTSNVYAQTGEYSVTITGKGNYKGTRVLKLMAVEKIVKPKPVSIAKAALNGFDKSFIYTGKACRQECKLTVKTSEGEKILTEGMDYTVQYANNIKAGTATVTYYGRNRYTGKLKKTYKILPYDILSDPISKIKYENNVECIYAKGGSKPKPVVTFEGKALKEGVDYTLSYKNNQAVYGNQTPCVIVNGTGCFKGKISINFTIKAQNLSKMTLVSGDKVYKNKANIYKITPKLMDMDGRLLSAGKDFDPKSMTYVYENDVVLENGVSRKAGSGVEKTDIIPADTQIRITLNCGNGGNYIGDFTGTYRITKADIKSAEVAIPKQIYTGNEILLDKSQITVKLSGVILNPEDYEIVRYDNNVKKGTASVTIRGTRNYGGIKTAKFTISTKGLLWWWRK